MKLSKIYEAKQYEANIYALWEKAGVFTPQGDGPAYSVIMPPPNANASLHVGHSLTYVLQDVAVRYHRLKGDRTLYVPGADHAGFETQVVYEKQLEREGKSRFEFSREELYRQIWDFVQGNKHGFQEQLRQLGISCDWSKFMFTLDPPVVGTVYTTFKKMWDEGLIYRGERLINFCTHHGTGFADIEVEYKEEKGKLWYLRYPLTDGSGEIIVATTRPETMLGDTAVAVHPDDKRYGGLVGKTLKLPLTNREIPIIADPFVEVAYGTGAVKLTPAHDMNDYEAAQRHNLPMVRVIDYEGKLSGEVPPAYRGLSVTQARERIAADLEKQGVVSKTETIKHNVGHCYKCHTVIEPMLREQWFVNMQPLAQAAIKVLEADDVTFYPAAKKQQLITYLQHVRDWNISRQIAWGIPIPAFQNVNDPDDWIYNEHVYEELIAVNGKTYRRDPDVFDTWFSSSQWPYVTLGYPHGEDFKDFYPTNLMETGVDILYTWVSRMLCLGLYITGEVPFRSVYLHGMVRSEDGRKMSKSLGNVVGQGATIEEFGTDALRLGILSGRSAGYSAAYAPKKTTGGRNFCNKLWNIARFIEDKAGDKFKHEKHQAPATAADHWVLSKLQQTIETMTADLDAYRFNEAYETLHHFVWDDFADWYIETSKVQPNIQLLVHCLESILKLAHPFAPFVTETIWQTLAWQPDSLLAGSRWPEILIASAKQVKEFEEVRTIITEVRYVVSTLKLKKTKLHYLAPESIKANAPLIEQLTHIQTVTEVQLGPGLRLVHTAYTCWLDIDNKTLQAYVRDLKQKRKAQRDVVFHIETRAANPTYLAKAPPAVIEQTKQQLAAAQMQLDAIEQEYKRFAPPEVTKPGAAPSDDQTATVRPQTAGGQKTPEVPAATTPTPTTAKPDDTPQS